MRQETSGRSAGDHVARGLVAAAFQQPFGPVAHDGQGQAEETQDGGREGQQTGQQTGPYAHRVLAVVRIVSRGTCGAKTDVISDRWLFFFEKSLRVEF